MELPWGPGGSVGFELATGHPIATAQSDLDIVIYAESRMTHDEARLLHESAQGLPAAVDIRIENTHLRLLSDGVREVAPQRRFSCASLWHRARPRSLGRPPMSIAFLFPGQGSQAPGMLHTLPDHPAITHTLDEASTALHRDVRDLDSPEALQSTLSVQLALLTAGVATARALAAEGVEAEAVAGLSVGAFAAAVHSGMISFPQAIQWYAKGRR